MERKNLRYAKCREVSMTISTIVEAVKTTDSDLLNGPAGVDAQLLHAGDQCCSLDAHARGSALWTGDATISVSKNAQYLVAFLGAPCPGQSSGLVIATEFA